MTGSKGTNKESNATTNRPITRSQSQDAASNNAANKAATDNSKQSANPFDNNGETDRHRLNNTVERLMQLNAQFVKNKISLTEYITETLAFKRADHQLYNDALKVVVQRDSKSWKKIQEQTKNLLDVTADFSAIRPQPVEKDRDDSQINLTIPPYETPQSELELRQLTQANTVTEKSNSVHFRDARVQSTPTATKVSKSRTRNSRRRYVSDNDSINRELNRNIRDQFSKSLIGSALADSDENYPSSNPASESDDDFHSRRQPIENRKNRNRNDNRELVRYKPPRKILENKVDNVDRDNRTNRVGKDATDYRIVPHVNGDNRTNRVDKVTTDHRIVPHVSSERRYRTVNPPRYESDENEYSDRHRRREITPPKDSDQSEDDYRRRPHRRRGHSDSLHRDRRPHRDSSRENNSRHRRDYSREHNRRRTCRDYSSDRDYPSDRDDHRDVSYERNRPHRRNVSYERNRPYRRDVSYERNRPYRRNHSPIDVQQRFRHHPKHILETLSKGLYKRWDGDDDELNAPGFIEYFDRKWTPNVPLEEDLKWYFISAIECRLTKHFTTSCDLTDSLTRIMRDFKKEFYDIDYQVQEMNMFTEAKPEKNNISEFVRVWANRLKHNSMMTIPLFIRYLKQQLPYEYSQTLSSFPERGSYNHLIKYIMRVEQEHKPISTRRHVTAPGIKSGKVDNDSNSTTPKYDSQSQRRYFSKSKSKNKADNKHSLANNSNKPNSASSKTSSQQVNNVANIAACSKSDESDKASSTSDELSSSGTEDKTDGFSANAVASNLDKKGNFATFKGTLFVGLPHIISVFNLFSNTSQSEYNLVDSNITLNKLYDEFKKVTIPDDVTHLVVYVGQNEINNKYFDKMKFEHKLAEFVNIVCQQNNKIEYIVFLLNVPKLTADRDVDYWQKLNEVNRAFQLHAASDKRVRFFNTFNLFTKKNSNYNENNRYFYVFENEPIYSVDLSRFVKLSPTGKPVSDIWSTEAIESVARKLNDILSTLCKKQLVEFQPKKVANAVERDGRIDRLFPSAIEANTLDQFVPDVKKEFKIPIIGNSNRPDRIPKINIEIGNRSINALIDSGCSHVLINEQLYNELKANNPEWNACEFPFRGGSHFRQAAGKAPLKIKTVAIVAFKFEDQIGSTNNQYRTYFFVTPNLNQDILFGRSAIADLLGCVDFNTNSLRYVDPISKTESNVPFTEIIETASLQCELNLDFPSLNDHLSVNNVSVNLPAEFELKTRTVIESLPLGKDERSKLFSVLADYPDVFTSKIGCYEGYEHEFEFDEPPKDVFCKTRPIPHQYEKAVDECIQEWVDNGIIEERPSTYKVGLVCVEKANGKVRPCGDFKPLNAYMRMHSDEVPIISHLTKSFKGKKFFSSLDFSNGFLQVKLKRKSQKYCSFVYKGVSYVFLRVPYGTKDSLQAFLRVLRKILKGLPFVVFYVDDVLIFSCSLEEHLEHLKIVLERIRESGMTLNLSKSKWCREEIKFLGLILNSEGCKVDEEKVKSILEFPPPTTVEEVQRYIGFFQYYREFIPHIATLCQPLYDLTTIKETKFIWTSEAQLHFENLKKAISEATLLIYPDWTKEFLVYTDASTTAIAGVVMQEIDGIVKPISFSSRTLRAHERNYSIFELELLAVVHTLCKNYYVLAGSKIKLYTDNSAVTYRKRNEMLPPRILRWMLWLENFNLEILHVTGASNVVADFLSRHYNGLSAKKDINVSVNSVNLFEHVIPDDLLQSMKNLRQLQEQDKRLCMFVARDDPRVKLSTDHNLYMYKGRDEVMRIYIPFQLQKRLVKHYHLEYGHVGSTKLVIILRRNFDWPDLTAQVIEYVSNCSSCQLASRRFTPLQGPMQPIIVTEFNHTLNVDFFGPLTPSRGGVNMIFVIEDSFTKYVRLFPMKAVNSTNTVKCVESWIKDFGKPNTLLSDNGPQFKATFWKSYWRDHGVRVRFTSYYNPSSNPAERVMATIGNVFRHYTPKNQGNWVKYVNDLELKLNLTESMSTRCIPYELVFNKVVPDPLVDCVCLNRQVPTSLKQTAVKNYLKSASDRKSYFDRTKKISKLVPGDRVMLRQHNKSNKDKKISAKLCHQWLGPFVIRAELHPNRYQLVDQANPHEVISANIRQLKKLPPLRKVVRDSDTPQSV